jgi:hypothetical protein
MIKSYNKENYRRAKNVIKVLIEGLHKALTDLNKGELKRLTMGEKIDVNTRKQLNTERSDHGDSILYCLLFFDGLMMVNVDFVKILLSQAENIGIELKDLIDTFYTILDSSHIEETSKEISSHVLCGIVSFTEPDKIYEMRKELYAELMQWTFDYCQLKYIITL